jgi:XTP/dITP diphosphohydrolase
MKLLLATTNPHKLDEIKAVLTDAAMELVSLEDIHLDVPEPIEDADTFEANATIKACYYARAAGMACIADDSGLAVDALDGQPGVHSASYAGVNGPRSEVDSANNKKLLQQLADVKVDQRSARFVCAMVLCQPGCAKPLVTVPGTVEGRILCPDEADDVAHPHRGRGNNGFGYDPLFFVPHLGKTTAELSPDEKNAISHRGNAARKLWEQLRQGAKA